MKWNKLLAFKQASYVFTLVTPKVPFRFTHFTIAVFGAVNHDYSHVLDRLLVTIFDNSFVDVGVFFRKF